MQSHRSMPGVYGPGYLDYSRHVLPRPPRSPDRQRPSSTPADWLQGWLLQKIAGQLSIGRLPAIQWLGSAIRPSVTSPMMPVGLGCALYVIPVVTSLVVAAIQLAMLAVAAAFFSPVLLDAILSAKSKSKSKSKANSQIPLTNTSANKTNHRMVMAGIAGVLAVGYSLGTIASLVVVVSSAYGCLSNEHTKGAAAATLTGAPMGIHTQSGGTHRHQLGMPSAQIIHCPFRRMARHCRSFGRLFSARRQQ